MRKDEIINSLKDIDKKFLIYRNGMVTDALKKAGYPHSIIFGLQIPQLKEISASLRPEKELAQALWERKNIRESRLLSIFIFSEIEISLEEILTLINDLQTREETEILSFKILRNYPLKADLLKLLSEENKNQHIPYLVNLLTQ